MSSKAKKYDWIKLKTEWLTSDFLVIKDFLEAKGMVAKNFMNETAGWAGDKKKFKQEAEDKAIQALQQADVEDTQKIRERQARLARFMQLKGASEMKNLKIESAEDARKMIQTGLQEERRALGLEGNTNHQSLTQININGGPKTNIDKMVEGFDYEELLEFIAELRREKSKRLGAKTITDSAGQAQEGEVL